MTDYSESDINELTEQIGSTKITNRGTGAGGSNTNKNGLKFENITNIEDYLLNLGFEKKIIPDVSHKNKYNYYLTNTIGDFTIVYVLQNGFCKYMTNILDCNKENIFRNPDEAYIIKNNITGKYIIWILEKKYQNRPGSVENKLWCTPTFKEEYEYFLNESSNNITIEYALCVNASYYKVLFEDANNKKYWFLKKTLDKSNVILLYGDESDYFEKLYKCISSSLSKPPSFLTEVS